MNVNTMVLCSLCGLTGARAQKTSCNTARYSPVEICCAEWQRLVRMRHFVTLHCLKDPRDSSWMDTWLRGIDENFISTTSLCR
ncbi:hypothetical protein PR001_g17540 [Phytophthora rubi]|nr:hypothetical protein PR002_g17889 [Phytophthora rubi]KAE9005098.1 hypothetical protein PR001_g17540 [Phytophthora rubi]